jgi:hypothetical protein
VIEERCEFCISDAKNSAQKGLKGLGWI